MLMLPDRSLLLFHNALSWHQLENPANTLCEAMGGGKERVTPGCLSPGASLRVVGVFYRRMGDMRAVLGVALVG